MNSIIDREKTCCFTGHREIAEGEAATLVRRLDVKIRELIGQGVVFFGCGGAVGFDTMAGFAVLTLKAEYPHIKLIMVLPCREQDKLWPEPNRVRYRELLAGADKIVYVSDEYTDTCMKERNNHLVQYSGVCIAYYTKQGRSGTAYTIKRAQEQGLAVHNLA